MRKSYKKNLKGFPIIPTSHFINKIDQASSANIAKINKCLSGMALERRSSKVIPSLKVRTCGDMRIIYKISNKGIFPITYIRRKKGRK